MDSECVQVRRILAPSAITSTTPQAIPLSTLRVGQPRSHSFPEHSRSVPARRARGRVSTVPVGTLGLRGTVRRVELTSEHLKCAVDGTGNQHDKACEPIPRRTIRRRAVRRRTGDAGRVATSAGGINDPRRSYLGSQASVDRFGCSHRLPGDHQPVRLPILGAKADSRLQISMHCGNEGQAVERAPGGVERLATLVAERRRRVDVHCAGGRRI